MLFATSIIFFLDFVRNFILIDSQHSNLSSPTVIDFDNFEFLQKNYKKDNNQYDLWNRIFNLNIKKHRSS